MTGPVPFTDPGLSAWLTSAGVRVADSAAALESGVPTVLTDASVTWGRDTTTDQPGAATASFTVAATRGTGFLQQMTVGTTVELWASGEIPSGMGQNTMYDPGFETAALGPLDPNRYAWTPNALPQGTPPQVVGSPVHSGARALSVAASLADPVDYARYALTLPPAPFSPDDLTAWDLIQKMVSGQTVYAGLSVKAPIRSKLTMALFGWSAPVRNPPRTAWTALSVPPFTPDGTWHTFTALPVTIPSTLAGMWAGLSVSVWFVTWGPSAGSPGMPLDQSWADTPGSWADYGTAGLDDVSIQYPALTPTRDVKVFTGRITDQTATFTDGRLNVAMVAADPIAELGNTMVGDQPWAVEALSARVARIMALTGTRINYIVDSPAAGRSVTWRDVDRQAAAGLVQELAVSAGAVAWMATHSTTGGPYWYIEDPSTSRGSLYTLALDPGSGLVVRVPVAGRGAFASISARQLLLDPVKWHRSVSDLTTVVDLTWLEQTVNDKGQPAPTERHITAQANTATLNTYGYRRLGVSTQLAAQADAQAVTDTLYARYSFPGWRLSDLTWDTSVNVDPWTDDDTTTVLDLLDGQRRIGHGVMVTDLPGWSPVMTERAPLYLEGGTYRFTGARTDAQGARWVLEMHVSTPAGQGVSAPWSSLDPSWKWAQFSPDIAWADMIGTAGPVTP